MKYARLAVEEVPQSEPLDDRQVKNNAGGFVFALDDWARLDRFLILGSDSNTYYQKARAITRENAKCVERCYAADPTRTVVAIVDISHDGRAPKNDAAIFALALGAVNKDVTARKRALANMHHVCRTSTHLFQFITCCRALGRGWGRALKRAVANWYDNKSVQDLAYQVIKYREREGYSHKRMLQTAHPKGDGTLERDALYSWICGKEAKSPKMDKALPAQVKAHLGAMKTTATHKDVLELIAKYKLPWEAIPTSVTKDPDVWRVMLPDMGLTALIRNLGGMTQYGTLVPLSEETKLVVGRLTDEKALKKARIHPFNVLLAHAVYGGGKAYRGNRAWTPVPTIVDALEEAFYLSFKNVDPSGKRTLIGLDVSGSMSSPLMGSPLEVCAGAAAMAMVTLRTEKEWHVCAFNNGMEELNIGPRSSLEEVLKKTRDINAGGTDCSLPMVEALKRKWDVDTFVVYTDNETWAGRTHPIRALQEYRQKTGIGAKLIVVGMTSTGFTIADPDDVGMLDVVGFDSAAPALIGDFARD